MLGLAAAVALAYGGWRGLVGFERTDNAYVKADISYVSARVSGQVQEVLARNNQQVRRGQLLAKIDPRDYDAAVMAAEAEAAQARAALGELGARVDLQQAQIVRAHAATAAARADAERLAADHARVSALMASGFVPRQRYELAQATKVQAQSAVIEAAAVLRQGRQQVIVLGEERRSALAALSGAEARLYKARLDRSASEIRSPIDGVVTARQADVGEYVGPGTRMLAIVPAKGLYVEANLRETQLARIRPGDRVEIAVDALPGVRLCGAVDSLGPASGSEFSVIPPDNASGNFTKIVRRFPVRVRLDEDQQGLQRLRTGMSVTPSIAIGSHLGGRTRRGPLGWLMASGSAGFGCGLRVLRPT